MIIDTGFDLSKGSFVTCFLLFFLSFLAFLVGVDVEIVLIFILIPPVGLLLPSFVDFSEVNTGDTDFFSTSGVRQGLLRISVIYDSNYFASFGSSIVEEIVRKIERS